MNIYKNIPETYYIYLKCCLALKLYAPFLMMNIDFAILYFGLTRSTKKVYMSHIMSVYNLLDSYNISYMKFMHTWRTNDNKQRVWYKTIEKEIDYTEYKLLQPDVYKIENQEDFLNTNYPLMVQH